MKTAIASILALTAVVLLPACGPVSTLKPFAPRADAPDRAALEGTWQSGDGFMFVKFDTGGVAQVAIPEWKDDEFKVARYQAVTAPGKENPYFCMRASEDGKWADAWSIGQYKINDDAMIIWWAVPELFIEAISNKVLAGEVTDRNNSKAVALDVPPEVLIKFLDENAEKNVFDYKNPGVFHKISPK